MKEFFRKSWVALIWSIGMIAICFHDAAVPTVSGFLRQVGAYALGMVLFGVAWVALAVLFGYLKHLLLGEVVQSTEVVQESGEGAEYDTATAWRAINLAVGSGYEHQDACLELADLREAGWHIEKSGNERAGFVYLKLISPGYKE